MQRKFVQHVKKPRPPKHTHAMIKMTNSREQQLVCFRYDGGIVRNANRCACTSKHVTNRRKIANPIVYNNYHLYAAGRREFG